MPQFVPSWKPEYGVAAEAGLVTSGRYATVNALAATPRPAVSLGGLKLRDMEQGGAGTCFPPGTRIRMADGSQRKIEDIRLLDEVLTAEANVGVVRQAMVRQHDEPLVGLRVWGHAHLRMTREHPVLTRRGYVEATDIVPGDWIALPRYSPQLKTEVFTKDYVVASRRLLNRDRVILRNGVPGRAIKDSVVKAVPDEIQLTCGAGRIFGLFLAEGSTDKEKTVWTFSEDEKDTLVAELVSLLESEWGVEGHVALRPWNHSIQVKVYGLYWARLFESMCATGAGNKAVHSDLMSGPEPFLRHMFDAWLDGDGHSRDGGTIGATISHDLALNMFDIANACGMRPAISVAKPQVNRYAKTRQPVWNVKLHSHADSYRAEMDDRHLWRRVNELTSHEYSGPVFNIGVEGDNSYVAEGIGVHNCFAHSPSMLFEVAARSLGFEVFPASRRLVAWAAKQFEGGGNPAGGGSPTSAIRAMTEEGVGVADEGLCPYTDDPNVLGQKPSQRVFDAAKQTHLQVPIRVGSVAQVVALIDGQGGKVPGLPTANGFTCPAEMQQPIAMIGRISGWVGGSAEASGHSELITGYAQPGVFDDYLWLELTNFWGRLYPKLPASLAKQVEGYDPGSGNATTSNWIRKDVYLQCCAQGCEHISATSIAGLNAADHVVASDDLMKRLTGIFIA